MSKYFPLTPCHSPVKVQQHGGDQNRRCWARHLAARERKARLSYEMIPCLQTSRKRQRTSRGSQADTISSTSEGTHLPQVKMRKCLPDQIKASMMCSVFVGRSWQQSISKSNSTQQRATKDEMTIKSPHPIVTTPSLITVSRDRCSSTMIRGYFEYFRISATFTSSANGISQILTLIRCFFFTWLLASTVSQVFKRLGKHH